MTKGEESSEVQPVQGEESEGNDKDFRSTWLCLHKKLLVLICRQCEMGVGSADALGHATKQHGAAISGEERKVFRAFCAEHKVCQLPEQAPIPQAGGPPVKGIAAPVSGYSCRADPLNCRYSVRDWQTL
ncbi:hypothetical protein JVT61DRAFT_12287 [Boletus reticuloceps]|uniref:Uncharacterized protein n=1 Tax=Boletus reticuloceps TaxID=495285 RepID=A0A8I2YEE0_9AGAM|nr:hypothetical protein JVT61DRAFT_12287 [Boletus reticuloceps]